MEKSNKSASLLSALTKGGVMVWISCILMGFANIVSGQVVRGLLFLAVEAAILAFLFVPNGGFHWISMLPSLGDRVTEEVWNESKGIYEYVIGDNSQLILLYGVASIFLIVLLAIVWQASVRSGYESLTMKAAGEKPLGFKEDAHTFLNEKVHMTLMIVPVIFLVVFTIIPLFYMMSMAFTNYSKTGDHLILFDWVGLVNFARLFDPASSVGRQIGSVALWTLIWAVLATVLNFVLGTIVAIIINRPTTRAKGLWRGILSLTIAVPQFVSLMIIYNMLQPDGIINRMLWNWNILADGTRLPFLTDVTWARVTVIIVNLWVGIPYTIMQVTGILKNIPADLYEAASIDGANAVQQFWKITIPYMMFIMTPYLITQFTGNINNFNVIYLTTRGNPIDVGNTAGGTDLLVTWLYKLTVDKQEYNMGAVIGIFTFVILSIVSLVTYRSTGSYKDEEGFK